MCGCEVVVLMVIPGVAAAWPSVAAAAAAAASAMGFAAVGTREKEVAQTEVEMTVQNSEMITDGVAAGQELVFRKDDVEVVFCRSIRGKPGVKVRGESKTKKELRAIGHELCQRLTQAYAYHRLMTKLRQQNFSVVSEEVDQAGTVNIQVSIYRG